MREIDQEKERWKKQVWREWNQRKRHGKREQVGRKIRNREIEEKKCSEKWRKRNMGLGREREKCKENDSDEWISWRVMVSVQLRLERKEWLALNVYINSALLEQRQPPNP